MLSDSTTRRAPASRTVAPAALPVVRPPDPPPAWIVARVDEAPAPLHQPSAVSPVGVEEGYAEGLRRAEQAVNADRERLRAMIDSLAQLQERLFRECEAQIVDLSLAIASELAHRSLEQDRDVAVRLASSALASLGKAGQTALRVSPADQEGIEQWLAGLPEDPSRPPVTVVVDAALAPGDVLAEAELGAVDARMPARLAQVARALREGERTS